MKLLTILSLIILSGKLYAQKINGQLLDSSSKLPVETAIVTYGSQTIITTINGKFSFQKNPLLEIVKVKKLGYPDFITVFE
ncbi:hypothetical protein [Pedobacter jamesrossensis]|uniref:CarboxypepD_reg-like domain-containing protein n=1 Tax=Pedobacter jamesrossensis TaxID=1908238 RepID=A0ABV8NHP2_9SPHI